jgi:putative membrane protein
MLRQFNWRIVLVRILVNALVLAFTALVVPNIYFVDKSLSNLLLMALALGILNALIKPILQFLTFSFIFVTYGFVVVLINAVMLWLLALLFPARFEVNGILWALVGGAVMGILSSFLESLLGITRPIVPEEPPELREQIEAQTPTGIEKMLFESGAEVEGTEPQRELPSATENGTQALPEGGPASENAHAASTEALETSADGPSPQDDQEATATVSAAQERMPDIETEAAASKDEGLGQDPSEVSPPTPEENAPPAEPDSQFSPQEGEQ